MLSKQLFCLLQAAENGFHHPVVQQCGKLLPLRFSQRRCLDVKRQTALQPHHLLQTAVMGDIGGFGRPGRNGARTRCHQQQATFRGMFGERGTVLEQARELAMLFGT
ncbi:hypothetical protein D3C87_1840900 [compost metagenome]